MATAITVGLLFVLLAGEARAQVYVSPNGDNTTGESWEKALRSISNAVTMAQTAGKEVWIAEGVYGLTAAVNIPSDMTVYGGFPNAGNPGMDDRDPSLLATTLDGKAAGGNLIVCSGVSNVRIDGLNLVNATGNSNGYCSGGALSINGTSTNVTIANCTFSDNTAPGFQFGGAMNICYSDATIVHCAFYCNSSGSGPGGVDMYNGIATLTDCVFRGNVGAGGGGGIGTYGSALTVNRCAFIENEALCGGGLMSGEGSQTIVTNSLFAGNKATDYAGAMEFNMEGRVQVANCTIVDSTASRIPGGLHIQNSRNASVTNCVFAGNRMYAFNLYESGTVPITNCLFYRNPDGVCWDMTLGAVLGVSGSGGLNAAVADATGNIEGDPLFADPAGDNFHILAGSPCLNAGAAAGAPLLDFDSEPRPSPGRGVDIGFDQFVDTDEDGMPDWWEAARKLSAGTADAGLDPDVDELTSGQEYRHSCDPKAADTDGDGYLDGDAVTRGINPHQLLRAPVFVSQSGDNSDGSSWAKAYTSLPPALAKAAAERKDVWVAAEDFVLTETANVGSHTGVYGGFPIRDTPRFRDRDEAVRGTVLRGEGAEISAFTCSGVWDVRINGFTLTGFAGSPVSCTNGSHNVSIEHDIFQDNHVNGSGGGIIVNHARARVTDCVLLENTAGSGGGIAMDNGELDVARCFFSGNVAAYLAGGIGGYDSGLTVGQSVFKDNVAAVGGGIEMHESDSAVCVDNCVFSGNQSTDRGGAAALFEYDRLVKIANCTMVGNTAGGPGGGIRFLNTTGSLLNCIFGANSPYAIAANDSSANIPVNNCLFAPGQDTYLMDGPLAFATAEGPQGLNAQVGNAHNNLDGDALFADAAALDFRMLPGSPCVDAGTLVGAPYVDFRGIVRPQGNGVDIGAYEGTGGAVAAGVAPEITQQPAPSSQAVEPGTNVAFAIAATGTRPLCYQWEKDGAPIPGAITPSFTLPAVQPSDAGSYTCVVTNIAGPVTSAAAVVSMATPGEGEGEGEPGMVTVPDVVGQSQELATTSILGAGLTIGTVEQLCSNTLAAGSVISQAPSAGASVATESAVLLSVSSGPCPAEGENEGEEPNEGEPGVATVPNVVGQSQGAATTSILASGLTLGAVDQQCSGTVAAGSVISQTPVAGTSVATESVVSLSVSSGPCPAEGEVPGEGEGEPVTPPTETALRGQLTASFPAMDGDSDGQISFEEAAAALPGLTQVVFDLLDANQDGQISEAEAGLEENAGCAGCFGGKDAYSPKRLGDLFLLGLGLTSLLAVKGRRP
jgi:hypothetical protein